MKIALLTDGIMPFVTGGMQKHSLYLAKYLSQFDCQITLFHCVFEGEKPSDSQINNYLFSDGRKLHKIITLEFPKSIKFPGHYLFNSYRYSNKIYKIIKSDIHQYDFIYIKGFSGWKLLKEKNNDLLTPRLGVNFHGMNMFLPTNGLKLKLSNLLFRPFVKFNMKCADHIFSYGSKVTSTINQRNIPIEKIIEIPTGIEKEYIVDPDKIKLNKKLKFLFVGRNDPLKGVSEIFKAIKKIDISLLDFEFIGPIPKKVNQKNIIYHGLVDDKQQIFKIMDDCDVLVLPSYSEGMPNVILEAMARGLIILATDVGAVNLLVSKNNGVLIENPNYRNIISAIKTIISSNNLSLLKMKKHSVKVVVNSFTWEKVVNLTIEKISSLTKI